MPTLPSKPRSSMLLTFGSLLFAGIFIREIVVHLQLSSKFHPDLVECTASLREALREIGTFKNVSSNMIQQARKLEPVSPLALSQEVPVVEQQPKTVSATGDGEHLISTTEIFRRFVLQPPAPAKVPYNLKNMGATHYSQSEQDKKIDSLLKQREKGFFIEVGAYDGEIMSNSLFFEKSRGWTGLLIEANPRAYRELIAKDRKAWIAGACIALSPRMETVSFLAHGMVGGVSQGANALGDKFQNLKQQDEQSPYVYTVTQNCFPLAVMLDAINVTRIDMFSLDVEGNELDVLRTVDFARFDIGLLAIETNGRNQELSEFLLPKGYTLVEGEGGADVIYMKGPA